MEEIGKRIAESNIFRKSTIAMAEPRHLPNAPITEAVIDLRAQSWPELDLAALATLREQIGYGEPKEMHLFQFGFQQLPGQTPDTLQNVAPVGFRYISTDEKYVAQFRKDGFTFSRLTPYTNWDQVFAEASRLYRIYVAVARPEEINRIAVRYINRMLFPEAEIGDFSSFLTAPPPFPRDVSAAMTGFLSQVQAVDKQTGISVTLTQTLQAGGVEPGKVPVILDLDIFEGGSKSPDPDVILPRFAALRDVKNRYFFTSITEKAVQLFL